MGQYNGKVTEIPLNNTPGVIRTKSADVVPIDRGVTEGLDIDGLLSDMDFGLDMSVPVEDDGVEGDYIKSNVLEMPRRQTSPTFRTNPAKILEIPERSELTDIERAKVIGLFLDAVTILKSGEIKSAEKLILNLLAIDPLHINARIMLADISYSQGDYDSAGIQYEFILNSIDTNNAEAWLGLAIVKEKIREIGGSIDEVNEESCFITCLDIDPNLTNGHLYYGLYLYKNRKPLEAMGHFNKFLELAEPGNPNITLVGDLVEKIKSSMVVKS